MTHRGCIGEGCPICPRLDRPGYEQIKRNLTSPPKKRKARKTSKASGCCDSVDWDAAMAKLTAKGTVLVPQPPPLELTPRHSRALVTVVTGEEGQRLHHATGAHMRAYAEAHQADFVKLTAPPLVHDWPMSAKFAIPRVLDHYEIIVAADADVLFRPGCMDLFSACAPDEFGAVDELPHQRLNKQYGHEKRHMAFRKLYGFSPGPLPWYFNAGVMVVPRSAARFLLPPVFPIPAEHCTEQDHTNAAILDAYRQGLVKIRLLDRRCNWQNWTDRAFREAPKDAVLHWSGAGEDARRSRTAMIEKWAQAFPVADPLFRIDARHRDWLRAVLMSGKFRRVLEIGCYHGYSTQAFIDALQAGAVEEVHLCDTVMAPEVEEMPATLHRCRSVDLLARDARFDLVFVDGDHTPENCRREAELLTGARVPVVFCHDTNAADSPYAAEYAPCDGPKLFREALAGYVLTEDCATRPHERTDRGMLAAVILDRPDLLAVVRSFPL